MRITMKSLALLTLGAIAMICLSASVSAKEPVKWSAPMYMYPRPWVPTAAPPNPYQNPYGYGYSYWPYGYSPHAGYYQGTPSAPYSDYPNYGYPYFHGQ